MKRRWLEIKFPEIGYDNSMGLVRYVLATAVIVAHFNVIYGTDLFFPISSYDAVGGFFALSGFLIFGSYLKHGNVRGFLKGRARRILPPYFLVVIVCAFSLVGVSTLTWQEYFSNPDFRKYLISNLCFLNFLQPTLPGVFESSRVSAVDASLWTMKIEISLYLSVPVIVWLIKWVNKTRLKISLNGWIAIIYLISLFYRLFFNYLYDISEKEVYLILGKQFIGQLMFFYSGVFLYLNFDFFKKYRILFLVSSLILYLTADSFYIYRMVINPMVISFLILSCSFFKGIVRYFNFNNVSYEMYLFHFPIINLQYYFIPTGNPSFLFLTSYIIIILLSGLSWFCIDRRFLPKRFV